MEPPLDPKLLNFEQLTITWVICHCTSKEHDQTAKSHLPLKLSFRGHSAVPVPLCFAVRTIVAKCSTTIESTYNVLVEFEFIILALGLRNNICEVVLEYNICSNILPLYRGLHSQHHVKFATSLVSPFPRKSIPYSGSHMVSCIYIPSNSSDQVMVETEGHSSENYST
ncbi:hypothetical protein POM88_052024 [Heracleum sosnowskyi]|uniref:Uncharacterized protein n=1 Tax=Heracleum sosnowskyi TaxID=360622 RepID=A0AAD8LZ59_9APIA|nr:hypothetical protein POM88_052024 [Heracleum sosnowskyi]